MIRYATTFIRIFLLITLGCPATVVLVAGIVVGVAHYPIATLVIGVLSLSAMLTWIVEGHCR
jgi:hypothetical protein